MDLVHYFNDDVSPSVFFSCYYNYMFKVGHEISIIVNIATLFYVTLFTIC
jgi:hypothetical protein